MIPIWTLATVVGAILILGVAWWLVETRVLRSRQRRTVLVTTKSGETFKGLLWQADSRALVLKLAQAVDPTSSEIVKIDGEVIILLPDVAYMQRP